jgi:hypothetical protein
MLIATEYEVVRRELEDILANRLSRTAQPYPPAHIHAALRRADALLQRLHAAMLPEPLNAEGSPAQMPVGHNEKLMALIAELERLRQQAAS